MKLILEGIVNGKYLRKTLDDQSYGVGRGSQNDLQLVHRSVSREHAKVTVSGETILIEDLGSRNGTFINEDRITGEVQVKPGDQIRFGAIDLKILPADAPVSKDLAPTRFSGSDNLQATTRLTWDELHAPDASPRGTQYSGLFRAMAEAGPLLVQPRPLPEVYEAVLDIIEKVITARRVLILLLEGDEATPVVAAARPSTATEEELMLSQAMMDVVFKERASLLVDDAQNDPRFMERQSIVGLDIRSALVAPLFDNENVIGLIYADTNNPVVRYDDDQLRALYLLANLVAIKITQTKLLEEQREKERMRQELATATRIQRSLLPEKLPDVAGYEIFADQWASLETAGDLYDVAQLPDGKIVLLVGDVSGKGLGAALLMSNVLASLRILYADDRHVSTEALASMAKRLNDQVYRSSEAAAFVTLFFAVLDPKEHTLEYVNAGHNPGWILTPELELIELKATGIPVGMMPGMPYESGASEFPPGSIFCLFTDGIPEAARDGQFYDEERMLESIKSRFNRPVGEIAGGIMSDLKQYLSGSPVGDDITLLLARRTDLMDTHAE